MNVRSYNNELALAQLLFARVFSNITIRRSNGTDIKIPCVVGNRSRIYKGLENRADRPAQWTLPLIVITRTGINRNSSRLANLHNEIKNASNSYKPDPNLYTPVPIDMTFEVAIMTKYPSDADMILSNFIPFFNQDIWVSAIHPKFTNVKTDHQIILEDGITEERPSEFEPSVEDIQTLVCTFTFKTELFGGVAKKKMLRSSLTNIPEYNILSDEDAAARDIADPYNERTSEKLINKFNISFHAPATNIDFVEYFDRINLPATNPDHLDPVKDSVIIRYDGDDVIWTID